MTTDLWQRMAMPPSEPTENEDNVRSAFDAFARFAAPELPPLPPINPDRPTRGLAPQENAPELPPLFADAPECPEPLFMRAAPTPLPPDAPRIAKLRDLHQRITAPGLQALDWRQALAAPIEEKNIDAIKQAGVIPAQYKVLELSQEAESEAIQLQASQFILAQNGHGQITKTEHKIEYEQIPPNQLAAIVRAKFSRLLELNPALQLNTFLPAPPIEVAPAETE